MKAKSTDHGVSAEKGATDGRERGHEWENEEQPSANLVAVHISRGCLNNQRNGGWDASRFFVQRLFNKWMAGLVEKQI